jgi:hypothetical protein
MRTPSWSARVLISETRAIGIGMDQRRAAQVHQRGDLLRRLHRPRLELERAEGLQPGDDRADQQQRQQEEGAPEQR